MPKYLVLNPLLSTRKSTDAKSPDYNEFVSWRAGEVMESWPKHTAIEEWLKAGHIEEAPSRNAESVPPKEV